MNVEIMFGLEDFRETAHIGAHVWRRHFGQLVRHKGPLHGIVVDKHNTVSPILSSSAISRMLARFRVPVCFECAKVAHSQNTVRMREACFRVFDVILRTDRQDDSTPPRSFTYC